jgi:AraC family transcriptional regulator
MHASPAPRLTLEEYYAGERLQKLTTSDSLDWHHARLDLVQHEPTSEVGYTPYLDVDVLAFLLAGSTLMEMHLDGGILRNERMSPGSLQLLPRQTVYSFKANWNAAWTYGALQLNWQMIVASADALMRADPERIEMVPTHGFNDPLLYHLGIKLTNEMQNASPFGHLYADSLTNRLALHLLRHYSTGQVVHKLPAYRLTYAQLKMIDEYIHAHLDAKISLTDLAACLHLSVPHFERMFRATTHVPPYRYVLELRLERARVLLQGMRSSLAEVALQCGFSSQSHFTAHFTRYVGVSPARFARSARE